MKTHTFANGKYTIEQLDGPLDGMCEVPEDANTLYMMIQKGNTRNALHTALHEAMHAEGLPDKYIDGERDMTENVARFLWRLGWRRNPGGSE